MRGGKCLRGRVSQFQNVQFLNVGSFTLNFTTLTILDWLCLLSSVPVFQEENSPAINTEVGSSRKEILDVVQLTEVLALCVHPDVEAFLLIVTPEGLLHDACD